MFQLVVLLVPQTKITSMINMNEVTANITSLEKTIVESEVESEYLENWLNRYQ